LWFLVEGEEEGEKGFQRRGDVELNVKLVEEEALLASK